MNFVIQRGAMKCGAAEAESRVFTKVFDAQRRVLWFYTLEDVDPGAQSYCRARAQAVYHRQNHALLEPLVST